jgi:hypothetical protein
MIGSNLLFLKIVNPQAMMTVSCRPLAGSRVQDNSGGLGLIQIDQGDDSMGKRFT